jgi:Glycosyltransferase involved in LPS biosynthesis
MNLRRLLPRSKCRAFGTSYPREQPRIERIYVINLDRRPDRWIEIERELSRVVNAEGVLLKDMTVRCSAVDAKDISESPLVSEEIYPFYTLEDQLFVEPQPRVLPERVELNRLIPMTVQEIAVALSHIGIWRQIAEGKLEYALVLEDDVWFQNGFARQLDQAWEELISHEELKGSLDLLYLSYKEVMNGAQKVFISKNIFCPVRGLWYLSGYILSRRGASELLKRLPCRGPVDLWINHQFEGLTVRATSRSIIAQRLDGDSSNSYSILPELSRIGILDSESASLFQIRPIEEPVFAFGSSNSGLSSLAMALSILGYRCCSDLKELPQKEYERLLAGSSDRIFTAYVNIGSLTGIIRKLRQLYPRAKFIVTMSQSESIDDIVNRIDGLTKSDAFVRSDEVNKWQFLCELLRCPPPVCSFPKIGDIGQMRTIKLNLDSNRVRANKTLKRDKSPWVIESHWNWEGIHTEPSDRVQSTKGSVITTKDSLVYLDPSRWEIRTDTFSGNLALFRPKNVEFHAGGGVVFVFGRISWCSRL